MLRRGEEMEKRSGGGGELFFPELMTICIESGGGGLTGMTGLVQSCGALPTAFKREISPDN